MVGTSGNVYGDRNLVCSCVGMKGLFARRRFEINTPALQALVVFTRAVARYPSHSLLIFNNAIFESGHAIPYAAGAKEEQR